VAGFTEFLGFLFTNATLTDNAASPLLPQGNGGLAVVARKTFHDEGVSARVTM
jgi:hypothetical protein